MKELVRKIEEGAGGARNMMTPSKKRKEVSQTTTPKGKRKKLMPAKIDRGKLGKKTDILRTNQEPNGEIRSIPFPKLFEAKKGAKLKENVHKTNNFISTVSQLSLIWDNKRESDTSRVEAKLKVGADLELQDDNPHRNSQSKGAKSDKEGVTNKGQDLMVQTQEQF